MGVNFICAIAVWAVLFAQDSPQSPNASIVEIPTGKSTATEPGGFPDFPPLPRQGASLIGGIVTKVDPIHDRMVVRAFGGRNVTINFDVRTRMSRGAQPAAIGEIRPGTRVYVDTISNEGRVFAKSLRIATEASRGESRGQVTGYDASKQLLRVRDIISSQPLALRITPETDIHSGSQPVHAADLVNGTLVQITFQSAGEGPSAAKTIEVLARPGGTFTFAGKIAVIDLRDSHLTLFESSGENTFEVGLGSLPPDDRTRLKQGMEVIVHARFDGRTYQAQSIEPAAPAKP
jgi:hypothetical protein